MMTLRIGDSETARGWRVGVYADWGETVFITRNPAACIEQALRAASEPIRVAWAGLERIVPVGPRIMGRGARCKALADGMMHAIEAAIPYSDPAPEGFTRVTPIP